MASIILTIVEGPSDETALILPLFEELKRKKLKINVKVMHGDILTNYIEGTSNFEITPANINQKIIKLIESYISKEPLLKVRDILKIIYITDTDRCFLDEKIHHINKKNCLQRLFSMKEIILGKGSAKKIIPIDIIFINENLEHILTLESRKFSDKEKEDIANKFSEECEDDFQKYINTFINEKVKVWDSYEESYRGIEIYEELSSNMNNFLQEYKLIDN